MDRTGSLVSTREPPRSFPAQVLLTQRVPVQLLRAEGHLLSAAPWSFGEAVYSQQKKDWELTVAQIMNSLLPNPD